jgi:hypothetical protein
MLASGPLRAPAVGLVLSFTCHRERGQMADAGLAHCSSDFGTDRATIPEVT